MRRAGIPLAAQPQGGSPGEVALRFVLDEELIDRGSGRVGPGGPAHDPGDRQPENGSDDKQEEEVIDVLHRIPFLGGTSAVRPRAGIAYTSIIAQIVLFVNY